MQVFAPIIRKHTPTWPSHMASYFDCTHWGAGFVRCQQAPGACKLNHTDQMLNLRTGEVYRDNRFNKDKT